MGLVWCPLDDLGALRLVVRSTQATIAMENLQRPQPLVNTAVWMFRRVAKPSEVVPQLVDAAALLVHVQRRRLRLQQHEAGDGSNADEQQTPAGPDDSQPSAEHERHGMEERDGRPPGGRRLGSVTAHVGLHHMHSRIRPARG